MFPKIYNLPEVYKIVIDPDAIKDIQNAAFWYGEQLKGLDARFKKQVIRQINSLKKNPKIYAVRYLEIMCLKIEKFPFLIHFKVDDIGNTVTIYAVFHTSRNPQIWKNRNK